jgi:hypothetical protein
MEFYSATKNEILSFASKWVNWRTSSEAKLAKLRRPKIICSPSYVDYRPQKIAVIFWTWATL